MIELNPAIFADPIALSLSIAGLSCFLGGLVAYCDPRCDERISIGIMLVGCSMLLIMLLIGDFQ